MAAWIIPGLTMVLISLFTKHFYLCFFSRYKLTAYFILFFGSGFSVPFLAMRHQLLKK